MAPVSGVSCETNMSSTSRTDLIKAHTTAAQICVHCVRLVHGLTDDRPVGEVDRLAQWCTENIGPRYVDWIYRGGGTWCFREQEDSMRFWLTWS